MNGVNLGWLASAPPAPTPEYSFTGDTVVIALLNADTAYKHYRVGIRGQHSGSLDFDTILTFTGSSRLILPGLAPNTNRFLSVANVKNNVESLFSAEYTFLAVELENSIFRSWGIRMLQNRPNPFSDQTEIVIEAAENASFKDARLLISDLTGRNLKTIPLEIYPGTNRVTIWTDGLTCGMYTYSLCVLNKIISSGKMSLQ